MAVHVVNIGLVNVDAAGTVKPKTNMTINEVMNSNSEMRVMPNTNVPNSIGYPTLEEYLIAEDGSGFNLRHLDNYYIITSDA